MSKRIITTFALGSAVAMTTTHAVAAQAENPFSSTKLASGYQLAEADTKMPEGKCAPGACGANMNMSTDKKDEAPKTDTATTGKSAEAQCGANHKNADGSKKADGSCASKP